MSSGTIHAAEDAAPPIRLGNLGWIALALVAAQWIAGWCMHLQGWLMGGAH